MLLIVWFLGNGGVIEKSYFVAFAPLFGNMVEMIFTAFALSWQFYHMREKEYKAEILTQEKDSLSTLVQVVCHDIANPLSVILASTMTSKKKLDDPEKQSIYWDRVGRAGRSINNIIDQVRHLQAVRLGKKKVQLSMVDMEKVFDEVSFNLEEKAKKKNIKLNFEIHQLENRPFFVVADFTALVHDVLNNLVSNAIKFSSKNSEITIKAFWKDQTPICVVEDHGIGMPEEICKNLFQQNKQTSRLGTSNEPGTGFGMPLAKYFIDQFHGKIIVESHEAKDNQDKHGTRIRVQFQSHL